MTTQHQEFTRIDSDFLSHGTRCSGWLYLPKGVASPPIVIMAHGFAAEKTFRLPAFAERFVNEGLAVLLFDYRCFGGSDGKPRNLVNPFRHVQDWEAAIAHVPSLSGINHNRIALWGSSLSGGHVMVVASHDPGVSAIISQMPLVDSIPVLRNMRPRQIIGGSMAAFRDLLRILTFRSPYCTPVFGDPGTIACMTTPECKPGYLSIIPAGSTWKNECPARVLFTAGPYRPTTVAKRVKCPALVIMGEKDSLIPPPSIEKAVSRMGNAELVKMPIAHFDMYTGEWFEKVVEVEARFLKEHLVARH